MRITINVDTQLGNDIKSAAEQEKLSVSAFVSSCVEDVLEERKRRRLGKDVREIAGKFPIALDALEVLCASRIDHENRV